MKLGWAAGRVLTQGGSGRVLIGKDTRISGYLLESALEAGLSAAGVDILLLGPMPTPGIAYLTRTFRAQAGIVISASHNRYQDNGIKFFGADGMKLPDAVEACIEAELDRPLCTVESTSLGKAQRVPDAQGRYIEFCKSTFSSRGDLDGLRIVVDCAHGATYDIAPKVFAELGADIVPIGVQPDGFNINDGVGATEPESLRLEVLRQNADLGIALDGDGDRVIMVDHKGEVVDGDELLFIIASERRSESDLDGTVVGTQMSNLGLEQAIVALGLQFHRAKVGDRYIMEKLLEADGTLGGESSGHIICLDVTTTGDGIVAGLQVLNAMARTGRTLNELKAGMAKFPQRLVNIPMDQPLDLDTSKPICDAVKQVEAELGKSGRVLLRPSGTEPLVRVMIEGTDPNQVERLTEALADTVREAVANSV